MLKLQKLMQSCFGYAAIVSSAVFMTMVPVIVRSPLPHATPRFHAESYGLLLIFMRELILLMPAVMAVVNGKAWWAFRSGAPSARQWAMAASASFVMLSTPFFVADVAIMQYSMTGIVGIAGVLVLAVALLSLGIAGFATFRKPSESLVRDPEFRSVSTDSDGPGALAATQ